ncbi:rhodanese-like domain-containing protein [Branchiibius cervicis]|uniref:Rhodanese-like domain-containing protein n=1 Tax=Branchiibius cervicis TaxID=908252 RepID=A0ABW2AXN7_9MICO
MTDITVSQVPDDAVILDVREQDEWDAGHAPNAVHIPLSELPSRIDELPEVDELPVVCRRGGRSAQAVAWLEQQGFDVVNVEGGMSAWESAGKKLDRDGATII